MRITARRKRCDFGLGPTKIVSLAEAHERAIDVRRTVALGGNRRNAWRAEEGKEIAFAAIAKSSCAKIQGQKQQRQTHCTMVANFGNIRFPLHRQYVHYPNPWWLR